MNINQDINKKDEIMENNEIESTHDVIKTDKKFKKSADIYFAWAVGFSSVGSILILLFIIAIISVNSLFFDIGACFLFLSFLLFALAAIIRPLEDIRDLISEKNTPSPSSCDEH